MSQRAIRVIQQIGIIFFPFLWAGALIRRHNFQQRLMDYTKLYPFAFVQAAFSKWDGQMHKWDFNRFVVRRRKYNLQCEIWTMEYIMVMAHYLVSRVEQYKENGVDEVIILEVGAGNGTLTHFLSVMIRELLPKGSFRMVATDSGKNFHKRVDRIIPLFPVEEIDCQSALDKYKPHIVISSWMPAGDDWTASMRAQPSVREYILIGDPYITGRRWETWGLKVKMSPGLEGDFIRADLKGPVEDYVKVLKPVKPPPYAADGFLCLQIDSAIQWQFYLVPRWFAQVGRVPTTKTFIRSGNT